MSVYRRILRSVFPSVAAAAELVIVPLKLGVVGVLGGVGPENVELSSYSFPPAGLTVLLAILNIPLRRNRAKVLDECELADGEVEEGGARADAR